MSRGILATCTTPLADPALTAEQAYAAYAASFADEPFVHLLPAGQWPQTQAVLDPTWCTSR
jgi:N-acetyl-gamma-glutamyl-phosphate reductase